MQRNQLGFSLVELMISITLGLFLMTGVVQMFIGSKQTFSSQQAVSRVQETGRLAVEFISRDIRMASYYGCFSPKDGTSKTVDIVPSNLSIAGLHSNFGVGVMGYKNATTLPNGATTDLGATIKPIANTNILVLRGADAQVLVGSAINTATEVYAHTKSAVVDGCVQGICNGSAVVVSDCSKARVFQVSAAPTISAEKLTLQHAAGWGGGDNRFENFDKLSEVSLMKTVVYFLAEGNGNAKGPSLYQKVNKDAAVELVEDVENISFTYGITGTTYKKAEDMAATDWAKVTAIKIELLVRSNMDNVVENKQPYTFATNTVAQADVPDRRIRKVFMATVGVRSRL
jgi:type IV pilus assembly protein PilW